uniref:Major facilitator superfamily (MFS) profile domain-containing protein n=1 Tax=Plectus sambesii TaxID=2011161 RepID=A0A914WHL8_9BILA
MDPSTFTWIWSVYLNVWFPGFLVGTLVAPKITDRLGRKKTPKFLLINRKDKVKANESIVFFQGKDINIEKVFEAISAESQDEMSSQKTSLGEIWRTPYLRKAQLVGAVALLLQISSGVNAMVFLSSEFFIRAGLTKFAADMGTVAMMALMSTATIFSMNLVDRCGRRPLLLGCGAGSVACLVAFIFFEVLQKTQQWASYGCLVSLLAFSVTFSLGLGPVPWFIAAEMVPQRHRALVQSVALTFRSVGAFSLGFLTLPMYNAINSLSFIPLLIIPSIIFLVFLYKKMPETKGQEVHTTVKKLTLITQTSTTVNKLEIKF